MASREHSILGFSPLLIGASTLVLYFASLAIYRLLFHPLAKFPGPRLAALTLWYEGYYDVVQRGQYTYKIKELHKEYGPIIRISPSELHVNDPSFYGQLYRQDSNWEKYAWVQRAFTSGQNSAFNTLGHALHRKRRTPLDIFLSKGNVVRRQDIIRTCVEKLHHRIHDSVSKAQEFDLGDALAATGTDIATSYLLGQSFNNLDHSNYNAPMTNIVRSFGQIWVITKHIPLVGIILLNTPLALLEKFSSDEGTKTFVRFQRNNEAHVKAEIAKFNANKDGEQENFDTLVQSILNSKQLPASEKEYSRVQHEVEMVNSAGMETIAQTLRWTCFHIYSNSKILHRMRDELSNVSSILASNAPSKDAQTSLLAQLERLPYLTAVIKEGLRMSPGVATRLARIAPDRDISYNSWSIPAGTPVGMTVLLMHYSEEQYPDPYAFNPERWMSSESKTQRDKIFSPFSKGSRMCVGMHLAWAELYITIATLVMTFDFEFIDAKAEDLMPEHDAFVIGTKEKHGPRVRATVLS